ncbi:MAG: membrane-associated phospholipid phosphatase [Myxococcota bacterium]|jgi:membrane-associated phospholipid phosphatase
MDCMAPKPRTPPSPSPSVTLVAFGFLALVAVVGQWDFEVSSALAVPSRTDFARFMSKYGMLPGFAVVGFGLLCLLRVVPPLRTDGLVRFGKIALSTALVAFLLVFAAKYLWGRVRFRDLDPEGLAFTHWLSPQGLTGHHSFPSGHTLWGALVLPLAWAVPRARRRMRQAVLGASLAWAIAMALARIYIGAHYMSDVVASIGIVACVMLASLRQYPQSSGQATSLGSEPHDRPGSDPLREA